SQIPQVKVDLRKPSESERSSRSDSAEIALGEGLRPLDATQPPAAPAPPAGETPVAERADSAPAAPARAKESAKSRPATRPRKPPSRSMKLKNMLGFGPVGSLSPAEEPAAPAPTAPRRDVPPQAASSPPPAAEDLGAGSSEAAEF